MSEKVTFDKQSWTERFAKAVYLELQIWRGRIGKVDKLIAFAVLVHPWQPAVASLSFLTDRETYFEELQNQGLGTGQWDIAAWRFYSFHTTPYAEWPGVMELLEEANRYWEWEQENGDGDQARDDIISCCANAVNDEKVQKQLSKYQKADDFEIFIGTQDTLLARK
jgi:hypothetical protein